MVGYLEMLKGIVKAGLRGFSHLDERQEVWGEGTLSKDKFISYLVLKWAVCPPMTLTK